MLHKKSTGSKEERLEIILHEWDCSSLNEAIEMAKYEEELYAILKEFGIKLK